MTVTATGVVATARGERYLKQLWSHFGIEPEHGDNGEHRVAFVGAQIEAHVQAERTVFSIVGPDEPTVIRAIAVVEKHLVKFGQRDQLTMHWSGSDAADTYERDRVEILAELQRQREKAKAEAAKAEEAGRDGSGGGADAQPDA